MRYRSSFDGDRRDAARGLAPAAALLGLVLGACATPPPAPVEVGQPPAGLSVSEGGLHFGGEASLSVPDVLLPGRITRALAPDQRYEFPVGGVLRHAMRAATEPSFDRVLDRQLVPINIELKILRFQMDHGGADYPAACDATVKVIVTDSQGRQLEKVTFSAAATSDFDGTNAPDALWRVAYDIADQFKDTLSRSATVTTAVERSKGRALAPVASAGPAARTPRSVVSRRFKSGYGKRVAAVVGINEYAKWPRLEGATSDAKRVAETLRGLGFSVTEIYDEEATRERILRLLGQDLQEQTDEESLATIFFAGHGYTEKLPNGEARGYIIPVDGDSERVFSTGISMETVRDLSNRLPAKHVYYAMDSCYSGLGFTRGFAVKASTPNYIDIVTSRRSVQMITAGQEGEQALERGGRGIFTSHFLRALEGEADFNDDGYVTASEIGAYVPSGVSATTGARQNPQHGTLDGSGEVVFQLGGESPPAGELAD